MELSVVALDPGGTTGWSVFTVFSEALRDNGYDVLDNVIHWEQGQFEGSEIDQAGEIIDLVEAWDDAAVVCEDFQLRTLAAELSPVSLTAIVRWWLATSSDHIRPLHLQMPSLAMNTATDDRLKSWGYYRRGQEHARDATRHALTFLRRVKRDGKLRAATFPASQQVLANA